MMDAVTYLRTVERVCGTYRLSDNSCRVACPLNCGGHCIKHNTTYMNQALDSLERWRGKHPGRTRQDAFLERYPDAELSDKGGLRLCPRHLYKSIGINCNAQACRVCMATFWGQEVDA